MSYNVCIYDYYQKLQVKWNEFYSSPFGVSNGVRVRYYILYYSVYTLMACSLNLSN